MERLATSGRDPECLRNRGQHQVGVADRGQRDPHHAVGEGRLQLRSDLKRHAGFAHPARAAQRHEAHVRSPEQGAHVRNFPLSAKQGSRWRGKQLVARDVLWCGGGQQGRRARCLLEGGAVCGRQLQRCCEHAECLGAG